MESVACISLRFEQSDSLVAAKICFYFYVI